MIFKDKFGLVVVLALFSASCATSPAIYTEPPDGAHLVIKNEYDTQHIAGTRKNHICQLYIDGNSVFKEASNDNIPYGSSFKIRLANGIHKLDIAVNKTFMGCSPSNPNSIEGELDIFNKDVLLELKGGENWFKDGLKRSLGVSTINYEIEERKPRLKSR